MNINFIKLFKLISKRWLMLESSEGSRVDTICFYKIIYVYTYIIWSVI